MVNYSKLREEDRLERLQAAKGECKLYDGTHSQIDPINARFGDNDTVKYVVLSDKQQANILYLQGNMVEKLYKEWKRRLGTFGPSEKKQEEKESVLYDVKLTAKQLTTLHRFLDDRTTP